MIRGYRSYIILLVLLLAVSSSILTAAGIDKISITDEFDSKLLPYDLIQTFKVEYGANRKPLLNPLQVYREKTDDTSHALIISAFNKNLNEDGPASVLLIDRSTMACIDEDPVYITIGSYCVHSDAGTGLRSVVAGCYRHDSAFVVKDVPGTGKFEYLFLASGKDFTGNGEWEPTISHIATADYDFDGHSEVFFFVFPGRDRAPRILFCIDADKMAVEWSLPVASYLPEGCLLSCQDSLNPSVIFTTYGPCNGVNDANFDDCYGYVTRVNSRGEIIFNKRILNDYIGTILMPLDEDHSRFCFYQMIVEKGDSSSYPKGLLTIIGQNGEELNSIKTDAVLRSMWLGDYNHDNLDEIYSTWSDLIVRIYDSKLNLIAESEKSGLGSYQGRMRLAGSSEPVFILGDTYGIGLYDQNLRHLAAYPCNGSWYQPLEVDSSGNTVQFILGGMNTGYIFESRKKGLMAYVRVIFWEYQQFIISALFLLLLLLLGVNYFRRKASSKLAASEGKYRTLVEGVDEAIFTLNRNGVYLFMNAAGAARLGGKPEDFVGRKMQDVFPEEIAKEQLALMREVINSGEAKTYEGITVLKNEIRRYSSSLWPIKDSSGKIEAVLGIGTDVTSLYEAKVQLEREKIFTESILDTSNSLIVGLDEKARIVIFNSELEKVTGYKREEVIGMNWPETFLPEEYRHEGLKDFAGWVKMHPADQCEGAIITKSGQLRTILWSNSALFSPETGAMTMAIAIGYDMTEKKEADRALKESEEKLRVMFDTAVHGIMICDLQLKIIEANHAAGGILGLKDKSDLNGVSILAFVRQEDQEAVRKNIETRLNNDSIILVEFTCIRADGKEIPAEISAAAMRDEAGVIMGFAGGIRDCTIRKTAELRDRSRLKLLQDLRKAKKIDECLDAGCLAIHDSRLYKRSVLTLHNEKREIINLGQYGLESQIVEAARHAPAPDKELSKQMTQERFRISHSFFVPRDSGLISPEIKRVIPQSGNHDSTADLWQGGDELFVPILKDDGEYEGWLSVDTPFDGRRPGNDIIYHLEEIVDIVTKKVHEIQSLERLTLEREVLKEINIALHESEERFRGLVETARDVIFTINHEGILDSLNPAFEQVTGWSVSDWIGKAFYGLIHPDDLELAIDQFKSVFRGEIPPVYELRIMIRGGHYLVGEFLSTPQIVSGRVVKSLGVGRDITERKRIEKALEYRLASESLVAGISTSFINLSSDEISGGIDHALQRLGEFAGVDISFMMSTSIDSRSLSGTHRWVSPTVDRPVELMYNIQLGKFPWSASRFAGLDKINIPSVDELPDEAQAEKEILLSIGIKSLIIVPMIYGRNLIGGLGFAHTHEEKSWDEETIALLKIVGESFANALQRQKSRAGAPEDKSGEDLASEANRRRICS